MNRDTTKWKSFYNHQSPITNEKTGLTACEAQEKKTRPQDNEAVQFAMTMGIGWNLGNQMDAHYNGCSYEEGWGNKAATQQTFNGVAKAGFKSVRIPVTWMGHIGNAPTYTIEKGWLDRVAELVDMAHKAGLIAIINIHHDGFGASDTPSKGYHWIDLPGAVKSRNKPAYQTATHDGVASDRTAFCQLRGFPHF